MKIKRKDIKLAQEEQEILDLLEPGKLVHDTNSNQLLAEVKKSTRRKRDKMVDITLDLPPELLSGIKKASEIEGLSPQKLIVRILSNFVNEASQEG